MAKPFTAVVVGHGISLEGKGWGQRINEADRVIRLWNCHWQNHEDYGSRYDYGMFEISPTLYPEFASHLKRRLIPTPSRGWLGLYLKFGVPRDLPPHSQVIFQTDWVGRAHKLGGVGATGRLRLTRGTAAACWALTVLEPVRLILAGFDNIYVGRALGVEEGFSEAYRQSSGIFGWQSYKPGEVKMGNHDLAVERKLLEELAAKHGSELVFTQDVWV